MKLLVVALTFNPSTQKADAGRSLKFETSLVYRVNSSTGGLQGDPVSNKQTNKTTHEKEVFVFSRDAGGCEPPGVDAGH